MLVLECVLVVLGQSGERWGTPAERLAVSTALKVGQAPHVVLDFSDPEFRDVPSHELVSALIEVADGRSGRARDHVARGGDPIVLANGAFATLSKIQRQQPDPRVIPYLRDVSLDPKRDYSVRRKSTQVLAFLPYPDRPRFLAEILRDHRELAGPVVSALDVASKGAADFPVLSHVYTTEVRDSLRAYVDRMEAPPAGEKDHRPYYRDLIERLDRGVGFSPRDPSGQPPIPVAATPETTPLAKPERPSTVLPPTGDRIALNPGNPARTWGMIGIAAAVLIPIALAFVRRRAVR